MKALIKVGYSCNDHCTFCHTQDVRHIDDTSASVHAKIDRARQLGHTMIVFSGGEATIRPEVVEWATHVKKLGLGLGFITNGRRFSDPAFARAMLERGLSYVYLSLHGPDAKTHNSLVRSDAFAQSLGGVRELHGKVATLTVNCVVTRANAAHLTRLVELMLPFPELTLKLSMTAPKGGGARTFEHVVEKVDVVAAEIAAALRHGIERRGDAPGPRFGHDGVPLCLLPGLEHLYDDLRTNAFRTMSEVGEPDFFPVDDVIKVQPEACEGCALRGPCPGLFRGYLDAYPGDAALLSPRVEGTRSNSWNLVPTRDVARPPGAPCPVKADGTTSYDRGRSLFLRLRDRMRLYETETRDFADVELLRAKEEQGQVYLDVSRKLAPDDFSTDLRKLALLDECRACEARPVCTGCYRPLPIDVFTRDDEAVHALLRGLSGDVLDVGAGEGRYLASVPHERVRYTAVDPDAALVERLARLHPWARFVAAEIEALDVAPASLDHALVLRSYNHLVSPRLVLERLAAALRPGGTLTLVDNVAFGLLRDRRQATRAEQGPGRLEHRRNDDASRAHAQTRDLPLTLLRRDDVGPTTSNQWLLHYERTAP
ncbi:MAG: radical SAM protein [Polyangiaceae bacterium]|nr:radical SAM protein [Polyangiaceae bacterium]